MMISPRVTMIALCAAAGQSAAWGAFALAGVPLVDNAGTRFAGALGLVASVIGMVGALGLAQRPPRRGRVRRFWHRVRHGRPAQTSHGFEMCPGCGLTWLHGRAWNGETTPEGIAP